MVHKHLLKIPDISAWMDLTSTNTCFVSMTTNKDGGAKICHILAIVVCEKTC